MSIVRIGLNDGGKGTVATSPPSFDPTGRSYEHHGLTSRHEMKDTRWTDQAVTRLTTALTLRHKASNNKVWLTSFSLEILTPSDDGDEILSNKFFTLFGLK